MNALCKGDTVSEPRPVCKLGVGTVQYMPVSGTFLSYVEHNQPDSESVQGTPPQLRLSCRNESMHSGVVYDAFSMMSSSCLPLLNLSRKGLKPNTSVKSVNHALFIS